jgi:hypothetical protein
MLMLLAPQKNPLADVNSSDTKMPNIQQSTRMPNIQKSTRNPENDTYQHTARGHDAGCVWCFSAGFKVAVLFFYSLS